MKEIIKIDEIVTPPLNNKFDYFKEIKLLHNKGFGLNSKELKTSLFYQDIHVVEKLVFNKITVNFGEAFLFLLNITSTSRTVKEIEFLNNILDKADKQAFDALYNSPSLLKITFTNCNMKPEVKNQMIKFFDECKLKPLKDKKGHYELFKDKMLTFSMIQCNNGNEDTYQQVLSKDVFSIILGDLYQITDPTIEYSGL